MVHGGQHAGHQAGRHEQFWRVPAAQAQQAAGQQREARHRGGEGPDGRALLNFIVR